MSDEFQPGKEWLDDLIHGRGDAAEEFVQAFGPALQKIAASNMTPALQRRVGADDVFQSVCRTFFRRAQEGEFTVPDRESLWRLLCAITLNKVRMTARFHNAQKRGSLEPAAFSNDSAIQRGVTVEDAVEFADEFGRILASLGSSEAEVLRLKLDGFSHAEIAEKLQCTERTVGRLLVKARTVLAEMMPESGRS